MELGFDPRQPNSESGFLLSALPAYRQTEGGSGLLTQMVLEVGPWQGYTEVAWMVHGLWSQTTHFNPSLCHLLVNYSTFPRLIFLIYKMGWYWIPWWSSGWDSVLPLQGPQVRSLVGELRSHMPRGEAKIKKKKKWWLGEWYQYLLGLVLGSNEIFMRYTEFSA